MAGATAVIIDVLRVLTVLSSLMVRVSPFPDFYRVYKRKATGEVNILPIALLFSLCFLLVMYAYMIRNFFPLFSVAVLGLFTSSGFFAVFYRYSRDRAYLHRLCVCIALSLAVCTTYVVLAVTGVTQQSHSDVATITGWLTNVPGLGLCIAPLTTIGKVFRTKSSASLPFTMCVVLLVNSVLWIAYSSLDYNFIILFPNVIGCVLSSAQVALCFVYPAKHPSATIDLHSGIQSPTTKGGDDRVSISISMPPSPHTTEHFSISATLSPVRITSQEKEKAGAYYALHSPSVPKTTAKSNTPDAK